MAAQLRSRTISEKQTIVETYVPKLIIFRTAVFIFKDDESEIEVYELTRPATSYSVEQLHEMKEALEEHLVAVHKAQVEIVSK